MVPSRAPPQLVKPIARENHVATMNLHSAASKHGRSTPPHPYPPPHYRPSTRCMSTTPHRTLRQGRVLPARPLVWEGGGGRGVSQCDGLPKPLVGERLQELSVTVRSSVGVSEPVVSATLSTPLTLPSSFPPQVYFYNKDPNYHLN